MKHIRSIASALTAAALLTAAMPAHAAYSGPEEIGLALRPVSADSSLFIHDGTVYVSPAAAAAGAVIHTGVYIEAERADLAYIKLNLQSDCTDLTFDKDTFVNPSVTAYSTAQDFTLPDGTVFSTRFKPYALGCFNSSGTYITDCMWVMCNFLEDNSQFVLTWQHSYSETGPRSASFLGGTSDAFSLVDLDLHLAPGTAAGVHRVDYIEQSETENGQIITETYVCSDDTPVGDKSGSVYTKVIPAMHGLEIAVASEEYQYFGDVLVSSAGYGLRGDVNRDGVVNSEDASIVLSYTAQNGLGGSASFSEDAAENTLRLHLADADGKDAVNSTDASYILVYAAQAGLHGSADWSQVTGG